MGRRVQRRLRELGVEVGGGRADAPPVRYKRKPTHRTPLDEPMKGIDIFAGLGGMSIGAEMGGAQIVWAINHWIEAQRLHARNMPHAEHPAARDAGEIRDRGIAPPHDIMFAGPSCKGFTKAAGNKRLLEEFNKYRATMWTVIEAAEWHLPRYLVVENVPEAMDWTLYPVWRRALELLGYNITENILNAPDFGAGMNRERLFVMGVLDGPPLTLRAPGLPGRPFSDFLTWDNPEAEWSPIDPEPRRKIPGKDPLKDRWYEAILETHRRTGMRRFVLPYFGSTKYGYGIDRPLGSITTATRYALIDMDTRMMRWPTPREKSLAMGFPASTILPRTKTTGHIMLGNAVAPVVAKSIAEQIEAHRQQWA